MSGSFGHRTVFDEPFNPDKHKQTGGLPYDTIVGLDGAPVELPTRERTNVDTDGLAYIDGVPGTSDIEDGMVYRFGIGKAAVGGSDALADEARQRIDAVHNSSGYIQPRVG